MKGIALAVFWTMLLIEYGRLLWYTGSSVIDLEKIHLLINY